MEPIRVATMKEKTISSEYLHRKLVRAAQARAVITLLSSIPTLFLLSMIPVADGMKWILLVAFFGAYFVVSWVLTATLCRRMVPCPHCQGSLWECGSGNFKARRMRIRKDVRGCPHCGAVIE